jgi:uncharacterized membrane protein
MIKKLRGYLLTGLVFWLPIFVTVLVISSLLEWLNNVEAVLPLAYRPSSLLGYSIPGIGVVIALALFLFTGMLVTNWLGQKFVNIGESFLQRIPLVRVIYHTTKQIIQALLISNGKSFRQVVMIQYPKENTWTLAFLTGEVETKQAQGLPSSLFTVYVPTTPNPTSGFFLMLEEKEMIRLDITVEEALKMILSLGAIPQSLFKEGKQ